MGIENENLQALCTGCREGLLNFSQKFAVKNAIDPSKIKYFWYLINKPQELAAQKPLILFRCDDKLCGFSIAGKVNNNVLENLKNSNFEWKVLEKHISQVNSPFQNNNFAKPPLSQTSAQQNFNSAKTSFDPKGKIDLIGASKINNDKIKVQNIKELNEENDDSSFEKLVYTNTHDGNYKKNYKPKQKKRKRWVVWTIALSVTSAVLVLVIGIVLFFVLSYSEKDDSIATYVPITNQNSIYKMEYDGISVNGVNFFIDKS